MGTIRNDIGAYGGGSYTITSVKDLKKKDEIPTSYSLSQNYPNPFNPTTTIKYEIPDQVRNDNKHVTLRIYDILGREVVTLVDKQQKAGTYNVQFTTSNEQLTSGVYFYQLRAGDFVEAKKMILIK